MREPVQKYFKVGTIQWMTHPPARVPLMESLQSLAADEYFDAIEITHIADEGTREAAKKLLEASGLTVCFGAQPCLLGPGLNPNHLQEVERQKAEDVLRDCIDEAEYMGAKGIAFLAGRWAQADKDAHYAQLLKTVQSLCAYAAPKGMLVELEVFDYDLDKCALIGPAPYAAQFAADVRKTCKNFGLLVDLSHFPTTYETSRFAVETMAPYITHLHFGNAVVQQGCDAYGDLHPRFGYPNSANGVEELLEYLRVLKEQGFMRSGEPMVLSMEVQPRPDEDPAAVLANTKRALNRAWALLED